MSSRWYPIYRKGNPQLRVFLPNFWMKLVRPEHHQPENVVQFITPTQMSDHDIRQYLEKIYKIPVAAIRSKIREGTLRRQQFRGYVIKEPDYRQAFVTLAPGQKFTFPEMTVEKEKKDESDLKKYEEQVSEGFKQFKSKNQNHPGIPGWFSF